LRILQVVVFCYYDNANILELIVGHSYIFMISYCYCLAWSGCGGGSSAARNFLHLSIILTGFLTGLDFYFKIL